MNDYQIKRCLSKIRTKCLDVQEPESYEHNDVYKLKSYLDARQKVEELSKVIKLKDYSYISQYTINLCKQHKGYYRDIFYGSEGPYKVELTCKCCNDTFIRELCKGKIYDIIEDKVKDEDVESLFCEFCAKSYIKSDLEVMLQDINESRSQHDEELLENRLRNTNQYISNFLNPDNSWKEDCPQKDRFRDISMRNVEREAVSKYIRGMEYSDFLNTPYWKAISQQAKYYADFRCQLCGSSDKLNTHHKTYEHHGEELQYIKTDLIVLCKACHEKFHDIID